MTGKRSHKKPSSGHEPVLEHKTTEQVEPLHMDMNLSPITDKRSYDRLIKVVSLRIYSEFEKSMRDAGVSNPELYLVGFDIKKASAEPDLRMSNYVALNARLIVEKAFVDLYDYAGKYVPRVMREVHSGPCDVAECMESKVQHDIMMEVRTIAMVHIPEDQRFSYRSKFKVL